MTLAGFRWIVEGGLAGSGRPGLLRPIEEDVAFLRECGISTVVTLTQTHPAREEFGDDFEMIHFPIVDMGFPTPRRALDLCEGIVDRMNHGRRVLVHCRAGLGRTGMIAACCLVCRGLDADIALGEVRRINRSYVQTPGQEKFIAHFSTYRQEHGNGA